MTSGLLVHGHRGARGVLPENTIPAFEYAIEAGADAVELDVAVTRDDVLAVSHDPTLAAGAVIREMSFAQLRLCDPSVPSLDEVLELSARGAFSYDIELKSFPEKPEYTPGPLEFARLTLELIRKHRLEARVVVQSFDFRVLREMKAIAPEIRLAALWEGEPRSFAGIAAEAGTGIVSPQYELVTAAQVREARAAGLTVVPWTANTPADWEKLIAAGVDGIITDDPAGLLRYLKSNPS